MVEKCRIILERLVQELAASPSRISEGCLNAEDVCTIKKLAEAIDYTHEAYHIAIELETGMERDWATEHKHTIPTTTPPGR